MRKEILNIAKKHYLNKKWYTNWAVNTDWQKCIFDAICELNDEASYTFTDAARFLLEAANLKITEEDERKLYKNPSSVCLKIIDKYYQKSNCVSALEIE
jgi:hypothetical protein